MADQKTTGLTELSAAPASGDLIPIVDVSDTTMAATGTNKKLSVANFKSGLAKGDVGLGNVDNTSDANKPVSTATQTALDAKVAGPASVTDDVPAVFDGTTGKLIKAKTYAAFKTLLALVKGDVGLGNVDNTSDATKNAAAVTLTNKTLDNTNAITVKDNSFTLQDDGDATKQAVFQLSGFTTGVTRTYTLPNSNGTVVTTTTTQTLTNKTIAYGSNTITGLPVEIGVAVTDEVTALTTGTAKVTFRMPYAMTLTAVRANVNTASSSGTPTVDINEAGTTILSTKLTIDASEKTSTTAATPAVISDSALADDAEITIDIDVAGTGAKGLKVWLIGTRA